MKPTKEELSRVYGLGTGFLFILSFLGFSLMLIDPKITVFNMIFNFIMFAYLSSSWSLNPALEYCSKKKVELDELEVLKFWRKGIASGVILNCLFILPYDITNLVKKEGNIFIDSFGPSEAVILVIVAISLIFIFYSPTKKDN